jgi:hypothetical protein
VEQEGPHCTTHDLAYGMCGTQSADKIEERILTGDWDAVKSQPIVAGG